MSFTLFLHWFIQIQFLHNLKIKPQHYNHYQYHLQQQQNSFCKLESDLLGPFYKQGAPFKQKIGESLERERLIISGKVMDTICQPI